MTKPHLILLHGALGSADQCIALAPFLQDSFTLHTIEFEGHGGTPKRARPFRMEHFVENVLEYMDRREIQRTFGFGYSMGGFVALTMAISNPERVAAIATLGTKMVWDPSVAEKETALLDIPTMIAKVPRFVGKLSERHGENDWKRVVEMTAGLLTHLGKSGGLTAALASQIQSPVRVILGDQDSTVTLEESASIARALPRGELEVLPSTPHPFERVLPERLAYSLREFFIAR